MTFDIHIPNNLTFQDYIAVFQTARVWADAYDRQVQAHPLWIATLRVGN
jgi:hypothetical protein